MNFARLRLLIVCFLIVSVTNVNSQNSFSESNVLSDQYGVCAHVSRPNFDWQYTDIEYSLMNDCYINWLRTDFDKGGRDEVFLDVLKKAKNSNLNLLPIFSQTLNDDASFDNYVQNIVDKYSSYCSYWEAMNEPDLLKGDIKENARKYVGQLKKIYKTVKSTNPKNQILYSGLAGLGDFFDVSMSNGAFRYFDIMNFHTYASPENQINNYLAIKANMDKYGWHKPVWLTETGATTIHFPNFYDEVLPSALNYLKVNLAKTTIGIVYGDGLSPFADYAESYFKSFKSILYIHTSDLKQLDPKTVPVLLVSNDEYFPSKYSDEIVKYVKTGGIIICPYGAPFYYGDKSNGKLIQSNGSLLAKLHMCLLYFWTNDAKKKNADENPTSFYSAGNFGLSYPKTLKSATGRYLLDSNLKQNDRFIPMVMASNGKYTGPICGIYDLNSDLKGKIIVCTRMETDYRSEDIQAYWLPRSALIGFAYGIDKFFYYRLRASETNLNEREDYFGLVHSNFEKKPAYYAYKTLTTMCPNGSTRPALVVNEGVYCAKWKQPSGKYVSAFWSAVRKQSIVLKTKGNLTVYDYLGHKISLQKNYTIPVAPSIIYVVSNTLFF